ncbi:MAG: OmpA family protein [Deltaproteobacteria bacterium]|nr:OmpA family protein [Deltaproteobacteria bacterium]
MNKTKTTMAGEPGGVASWMVTFSDLSTLLLTFFVLLLSMSSMDDKTLKSLFTNFTSACGILYFKEYGEIYRPKEVLIEGIYQQLKDTLVIKRADDPVEYAAQTKETFLREAGGQIIFEDMENGFKLVFGHQLLFESGGADIKPQMKAVLDQVAKFITNTEYQVYIDGHTDNIPIQTSEFPSNNELSWTRAYNIMDYLVKTDGVSSGLIALAGYGEYKPLSSNDTPEGMEQNRRVEIIFQNTTYF